MHAKQQFLSDFKQDLQLLIMLTIPCNVDSYTQIHIIKLGFTGVYIIFLFLLSNIDYGYASLKVF